MKLLLILCFFFSCTTFAVTTETTLQENDILEIENLVQKMSDTFDICNTSLVSTIIHLNQSLKALNDESIAEGQVYIRCRGSVKWIKSDYCKFRKSKKDNNTWVDEHCDL